MAELTCIIDWPNGQGYTPCSQEYYNTLQKRDDIKMKYGDPNKVNLDDLSPDDYQDWNILDNQLCNMQGDGGHLGQSIRYGV